MAMTGSPATTADLIETIRVQLATWAAAELGVRIPPALPTVAALRELVREVTARVELQWAEFDDDDTHRGLAHFINAETDAIRADQGYGDRHLISVAQSLILGARILY